MGFAVVDGGDALPGLVTWLSSRRMVGIQIAVKTAWPWNASAVHLHDIYDVAWWAIALF